MQFPTNYAGCSGSTEALYAIHAHLIPVGSNRGKVLIWGKGLSFLCWFPYLATTPGDYDQQFAIVDADASPVTVVYGYWRIPAVSAPPIYNGTTTVGGYTVSNGMQGLFCSGHCWLPDGRLFIVGGDDWSAHITHPYADFTGSRMVAIYDPMPGATGSWSTVQQLTPTVPFLLDLKQANAECIAAAPPPGRPRQKIDGPPPPAASRHRLDRVAHVVEA
ncbi:MAG TPA: hypothetical protein VFZ65_11445, partial [Planctomycetota bacterium]|nr:hypothetical protein [Planctomycetota bacterium]